jgi:CheY-like chemotaxis protein
MSPKILIVDAEESDRLTLARMLQRLGCWCAL